MAVPPPLTNNTTKTSVEDLVKMFPAVAEQSHQKKRKTIERVVKHKTMPSLSSERRRLITHL